MAFEFKPSPAMSNHRRHHLASLALFVAALASGCGGGGSDDGGGSPPGGSTGNGAVVLLTTDEVNGRVESVIRSVNLGNRREQQFVAPSFVKGGVSVSRDGTVAYLVEGNDNYTIALTRMDGSAVSSFVWREARTFALGPARISPDGQRVAFSLNRINEDGNRGSATYICNTQGDAFCYYFTYLRDPGWNTDAQVVAVSDDRKQLYRIGVADNSVQAIGPATLDAAANPVGSADGRHIVFDSGIAEKLYALELASGQLRQLTAQGTGQFRPTVSADGQALLFVERCCGGSFPTAVLRAVRLDLNATINGGVQENLLRDAAGRIISASGQFGHTAATVP
jgi:Tol biopolymer transport system component